MPSLTPTFDPTATITGITAWATAMAKGLIGTGGMIAGIVVAGLIIFALYELVTGEAESLGNNIVFHAGKSSQFKATMRKWYNNN